MRRCLANVMLAGLGLALPLWAFGQTTTMPVIPALQQPSHAKKHAPTAPLWQHDGNTLSVTATGHAAPTVPTATPLEGQSHSAGAGVHFTTKPGITAHANVHEIRWTPLVPACAEALSSAPLSPVCAGPLTDGVQRGEVGAGFAGPGGKFDVSVGQSHSASTTSSALDRRGALPRVLPAEGGADVAAPLWFRNSTATSISAKGQLDVAPNTSLDLGASVGHVRFLPGSGLAADDTVDQTTLSLGVRHGPVRGSIVGHVLEPNLPGAALDQNQRWSGIDLGISVRLPWRGELNFGAQNVWSSGRSPLLFGPGVAAPDQGRVPYVQYHQDL